MHESRKDYEEHKADWTQEKNVELRCENHDWNVSGDYRAKGGTIQW